MTARCPVGVCPLEHDEQARVIRYAITVVSGGRSVMAIATGASDPWDALEHPLSLLYAVPNGSNKSKAAAGRFKAEGLRSGVPDLVLPVARGGYFGLYLEMKRQRGGTVAPAQHAWHAALQREGYRVAVCRGAEAAIAELRTYLLLPPTGVQR